MLSRIIIVLPLLFPFFVNAAMCDLNADQYIDINDIQLITDARGIPNVSPDDPRDIDGDGEITVLDARICINLCTLSRCAIPHPPEFLGDTNLIAIDSESFSFVPEVSATSPVTLAVSNAPSGMVVVDETVTWNIAVTGTYTFDVTATDEDGLSTSQTYTLGVVDAELSHEGSDFWLVFGRNFEKDASELFIYITADSDTSGTIDFPAQGSSIPFSVFAGQTTRVDIDPTLAGDRDGYVEQEDKGIHITSNDPIVVYAMNQQPNTTDGFLVHPTASLGKDYRVVSYDFGQANIVATQDNTTIVIDWAQDGFLVSDTCGILICSFPPIKVLANEPKTITLNRGETYSIQLTQTRDSVSFFQLTGTSITANKPIGVFTGNSCVQVPTTQPACDHTMEQLPSIEHWGMSYVSVPYASRFNGDVFRVVAGFDNTQIKINGVLAHTINDQEWIELLLDEPSHISANHPIMVAQFSKGASVDNAQNGTLGDPFMSLLTPIEQGLTQYLVTTTDQGIENNFLNIVTKDSSIDSVTLNGESIDSQLFTSLPQF